MATAIENLQARRDAICAELAGLNSSKAGGKPNLVVDGQQVDHTGYKKSLYDELAMLDKQIKLMQASEDGPFIFETRGYT